jgi:hypothetical protein
MANLTDADLDSQVVDVTTVPLAELRTLSTSELVDALGQMYVTAKRVTGCEAQVQQN